MVFIIVIVYLILDYLENRDKKKIIDEYSKNEQDINLTIFANYISWLNSPTSDKLGHSESTIKLCRDKLIDIFKKQHRNGFKNIT